MPDKNHKVYPQRWVVLGVFMLINHWQNLYLKKQEVYDKHILIAAPRCEISNQIVCPAQADMFSRSQSCQGKSQKPCSLNSKDKGNQNL